MFHITSSLLGGAAALAAWALVAPVDLHSQIGLADASSASVNRTAKAARLAGPAGYRTDEDAVATVEVVGVRDAAIIYRDRDGRVLFQTDPVTNVTVISKGFVLPELTVRESRRSKPVPIEAPSQPAAQPVIPIGCDPAVSPIAQPQLSHLTGRCLAQVKENAIRVAMGGE
jgi:hypothetical protein